MTTTTRNWILRAHALLKTACHRFSMPTVHRTLAESLSERRLPLRAAGAQPAGG